VDDLFHRLEAAGQLRRIDTSVAPTMYRCAIVSDAELAVLRDVKRVVRLGRVRAVEARRIVLDRGEIPTSREHIHVHCCADGIPRRTPRPMFEPGRILPQYLRRCAPSFSSALLAHIELTLDDDAQKNALCTPVTLPNEPLDWLRMQVQEARNAATWKRVPELRQWLSASRLNPYSAMIERAARDPTPPRAEILKRLREAAGPGLERMVQLLDEAGRAAGEQELAAVGAHARSHA
jgi:hypothetical protein